MEKWLSRLADPAKNWITWLANPTKKCATWLVDPAAAYFIYLGLLLPFVREDTRGVVIIIGIPFAFSAAHLWHRAQLAGLLPVNWWPPSRTIEAERFLLKDTNGKTRAVLTVTDSGAGLDFYDSRGAVRASMGVMADMPGLTLSDKQGTPTVQLSALADGPAHIVFYDAKYQLRAILDVLPEGPRLELYDRDGNSRAKLTVLEDGAHFRLFDATGSPVYSAP